MIFDDKNIYHEKCICKDMTYYSFFPKKLKMIEKIAERIEIIQKYNSKILCSKCLTQKYYRLANIIWPNNIQHIINHHKYYPSEYFVQIIMHCVILNNSIINPPLQITLDEISIFSYIILHYNKLLILDALMKQGSYPRYSANSDGIDKYIYSEHSGVIAIENKLAGNIIIAANSNRIDVNDNNIYLPTNSNILAEHPFLFHTHPVTHNIESTYKPDSKLSYAGRLDEGILYEFPSANDVLNFIKYRKQGMAQASIVIAPEGIYVVRPLIYKQTHNINKEYHNKLQGFIINLERKAVKKYKNLKNISKPSVFHNHISPDQSFIQMYNNFTTQINIFIEYYPRQKKNGEWILPEISLPYIDIDTN